MATTSRKSSNPLLEDAVSAWKHGAAAQGERLSSDARDAVLDAALTPPRGHERQFSPLFTPFSRIMAVGAVPALVLTLALGWLLDRPALETAGVSPHTPPPIHVTKTDGEIVFLIANGNRPHSVYKSGAPNRFDAPPAFWTEDGSFRDRLDGGPDLVFYRID